MTSAPRAGMVQYLSGLCEYVIDQKVTANGQVQIGY